MQLCVVDQLEGNGSLLVGTAIGKSPEKVIEDMLISEERNLFMNR